MRPKAAAVIGAVFFLLPLATLGFAASGVDRQLVEAVKDRDSAAVRALLKQHVNVNTPQTDGATALAWAAHWNDLEMADLLIHAGANVNAADDLGVTPLSLACSNGNFAIIEKLLKAGANPKATVRTGETALMTCVRGGSRDAVKALLDRGADVNAKGDQRGQTALMWAAAEKQPESTRLLIAHGADVDARSKGGFTPLLFAARSGDLESAQQLVAAGADVNEAAGSMNALLLATASGNETVSIFLVEKGADPNSADDHRITALHYALLKGLSALRSVHMFTEEGKNYWLRPDMVDLVKALLEHGANPNARLDKDPEFSGPLQGSQAPNYMGSVTPYMLAAATGDVAAMRLLSAAGADVRLATTGDPKLNTQAGATALMLAAGIGGSRRVPLTPETEKDFLEAVRLAIESGSYINAVDSGGQTALHYAAYRGSLPVIRFLVEKGAKIDALDAYGQTPLSIAAGIVPEGIKDRGKAPYVTHKEAAELLRKLSGDHAKSADVASAK